MELALFFERSDDLGDVLFDNQNVAFAVAFDGHLQCVNAVGLPVVLDFKLLVFAIEGLLQSCFNETAHVFGQPVEISTAIEFFAGDFQLKELLAFDKFVAQVFVEDGDGAVGVVSGHRSVHGRASVEFACPIEHLLFEQAVEPNHLLFELLALRNIGDHGGDQWLFGFFPVERRQTDFDRENGAVFAQGLQVAADAHGLLNRFFEVIRLVLAVMSSVVLGDQIIDRQPIPF